jgi:hypothetical protein
MTNKKICIARTSFAALALFILTALAPAVSRGASITLDQLLTGQMIETEGDYAGFLGLAFGPDASSPLVFTSDVNLSATSFSFSLNTGQTYLGQPISMTATGSYNTSTDILTISSSGMLGTAAWTTSGSETETFDSSGDAIGSSDDNFLQGGVLVYDKVRYNIKYYPSGLSTDKGYYTDKNGNYIPGTDFDSFNYNPPPPPPPPPPGTWVYTESGTDGLPFAITTTGITSTGGTGSFTVLITPIPEPGTLGLATFAVALLSLAVRRVRTIG